MAPEMTPRQEKSMSDVTTAAIQALILKVKELDEKVISLDTRLVGIEKKRRVVDNALRPGTEWTDPESVTIPETGQQRSWAGWYVQPTEGIYILMAHLFNTDLSYITEDAARDIPGMSDKAGFSMESAHRRGWVAKGYKNGDKTLTITPRAIAWWEWHNSNHGQ